MYITKRHRCPNACNWATFSKNRIIKVHRADILKSPSLHSSCSRAYHKNKIGMSARCTFELYCIFGGGFLHGAVVKISEKSLVFVTKTHFFDHAIKQWQSKSAFQHFKNNGWMSWANNSLRFFPFRIDSAYFMYSIADLIIFFIIHSSLIDILFI